MLDRTNKMPSDPLRGVLSVWFSRAKSWWGISLGAQVVASLAGALSVLIDRASSEVALGVGLAAVLGSAGLWRSESLRHRAELLLRHFELEDAFGWIVESKILADNLSKAIPLAAKAATRAQEQGGFFASDQPAGPIRALDNLRESAWWTQQLAWFMGQVTAVGAAALGLLALWSLLIAANAVGSNPLQVSNVVTAVIALVFAGNLVRLPIDYFGLSADASEYDQKSSELIRSGNVTERDALRLLSDYQLTRATAPLIPDWAWRARRQSLNTIWNTYRIGG
jgi:hypothetical protein